MAKMADRVKGLYKKLPAYQIQVYGSWTTVDSWIFRSWSGKRRIVYGSLDGIIETMDYKGPVYYLGKGNRYVKAN
jgi:hypothetical protein